MEQLKLSNQKGFALLLSMVMLFLLTSTLLHYLTLYQSEKRFFALERDWNTLDHLLLSGTEEVIKLMTEEEEGELVAGSLDFFNGTVHYQITLNSPDNVVLMRATTIEGRKRGARFTYVKETNQISNWVEGAQVQ